MAEEKIDNLTDEQAETGAAIEEKVLPSDAINDFATNNANKLGTILLVIAALIGVFFIYQNYVVAPGQVDSAKDMYMAEFHFANNDYEKALNGDDEKGHKGFLEIIEDYSGSSAANLAHYYAGVIYLKQSNYDEAIDHLESFKSDDLILGAMALSLTGDAYAEKSETDKAISYYKKASKHSKNDLTTPLYLLKLGNALELAQDYGQALGYYEMIQKDYPNSEEAKNIDKFIFRSKNKAKK